MSWGGVKLHAYRYVGNVSPGVDAKTIEEDIRGRGVDLVSLEENTVTHGRFKSFKLTVNRSDLHLIDDPDFWPKDVKVRRFIHPRPRPNPNSDQRNNRQDSTEVAVNSAVQTTNSEAI